MSVAKVNAITVPADRAEEFLARFAARAGSVATMPGFEAFELLRPNDDRDVYLVYTRWATEEHFQAWLASPAFAHGHRPHGGDSAPVSAHSELWSFDVAQQEGPRSA